MQLSTVGRDEPATSNVDTGLSQTSRKNAVPFRVAALRGDVAAHDDLLTIRVSGMVTAYRYIPDLSPMRLTAPSRSAHPQPHHSAERRWDARRAQRDAMP